MPGVSANAPIAPCHLGLDAGGTQTRWALADAAGRVQAEGTAPPLSGLMLLDDAGRAALRAALGALAAALPPGPAPRRAWAGVTGVDAAQAPALAQALATALRLRAEQVHVGSDIDLACRAAFAPGEGVLVYAGTGSVAAHQSADGRLHRVGGRGAVIDDAGGGHWLAREALCRVWRVEDTAPGQGLATPLGRALARAVGGADWAATRAFVYGAGRGELGTLALAVAEAAREGDATAGALLEQAGAELARLAQALHARLGAALPVALAGRVWLLHPAIEAAFRAALHATAPGVPVRHSAAPAHVAAARLAAAQEAVA